METALDGTVTGTADSGTSLWGEQLGGELITGWTNVDMDTCDSTGTVIDSAIGDGSTNENCNTNLISLDVQRIYKFAVTTDNLVAGEQVTLRISVNDNLNAAEFTSPILGTDTFSYYFTPSSTGNYYVGYRGIIGTAFNFDAPANSVKQVLNAWDSGDGDGLEPPHFTMLAWVRPTFGSSLNNNTGGELISLRTSNNLLINAGTWRFRTSDTSNSITVGSDFNANQWNIIAVEAGKINSNVSQYRIGFDNGSGMSFSAWADYDGSFSENVKLAFLNSALGYVHFGPLLIYRTHLDSTFYDALGGGG